MNANAEMEALLLEAGALRQAGRLAEAEAAYAALLARWPDLPQSWYNLALLQRQAGRFDAALASYRQALGCGIRQPEQVHLNRGVIYADHLRQDDAAERELNAALGLNPAYVPALLNLGNLHEDRGRREEALALYQRALAADPDSAEALARQTNLAAISGPDDAAILALKQAIARANATAADRASLGFALGRALDACAAYDRAFSAYDAANRASRASAGPGRALYDRGAHERFIDRLIEAFAHPRPGIVAPAGSKPPIFICGMFRSGSTLTEQLLAGHARVTAGGELGLIPASVASELAPFPQAMARAGPDLLAGIAARYANALARIFPGADLITDKRPDNFLYLGLIKALFPSARIVHTIRHPLDNCLSAYFLHLDHSMSYALDLLDVGHYYRQHRRLMAHWKTLFGADIFAFDYDDFVREPRPAVAHLLDFCGLDWDENCLSFHERRNSVKTASVWQVREPLYRRASGRWRHYARHLEPLREYLGDLLPDEA